MIANGANCPDKLFSTFYNTYNKIVNKHAPFKRLSNRKAKQLSKPWITTGIKASTAVKSKLYASGDDSRYKYYRNKICSLIRLSKKRYYYQYFEHNVANMKKAWEGINELLYRRKRNFKNITQLKDRRNIVKEASQIPNIKQLLDEVFVISRIIEVEVGVISRSLTETSIILNITKTESNNCFIIH